LGAISITIAFLASAPAAYPETPNGVLLKVTSAVAPVASATLDAFEPASDLGHFLLQTSEEFWPSASTTFVAGLSNGGTPKAVN